MRLLTLDLLAFGPFSGRRLVFADDGEQAGLQIVYGPNEAGKSSALRGLKALLYGIDTRSSDDFIHPHTKMRLGGRLQNADGQQLDFLRRKGRKDTLLNADGEAIDDLQLAPFLHAVSADMFSSLFGIDHPALLRGGQEILEQQGELGRALFSAALGSHDLNAVIDGFSAEAEALFKPRGSKQRINAAVSELNECRRQIRERSLKPAQWQQHSKVLRHTREELQQVEQELADKRGELTRLQRIERLQPRFAALREQQLALSALQGVVLLGADFGARRQQAVTDRAKATALLAAAEPRLGEIQQELERLSVNQALLDQAEDIEALHTRIGAESKARRDRVGLVSERQALLQDAERLLAAIRPDLAMGDIDRLRPLLTKRRRIAGLGAQQQVLAEKLQQAQQRRRAVEAELQSLQRQPDDGRDDTELQQRDIDALRQALGAARREGDLDASLSGATRQWQTLQRRCSDGISRAGLADRDADTLPTLVLPGRETIARFEQQYSELAQRRQRLDDEQLRVADELREVERDLDQQRRAGSVPSEAELRQSRDGRDRAWRLLRRQWIGGEDIAAEAAAEMAADADLPETFEHRISGADELADRLRREADRVQMLASLQARQADLQGRSGVLVGKLEATAAERSQIDADWQAQWRNGPSQLLDGGATPAEMRAWLEDFERLCEQLQQLAQQRSDADAIRQVRSAHIAALRQQLTALGQPATQAGSAAEALEPVLQQAEAWLSRIEQRRQQQQQQQRDRQRLQQQLSGLDTELQLAREAQADWRKQWREALSDSGLDADTSPAEAEAFIDKLAQLLDHEKDAAERQRRILGIDRDAAEFAEWVGTLVAQVAPDLAELTPEEAVRQLNAQLTRSRSASKSRQQLEAALERTRAEITRAELQADTARRLLAELVAEAGCEPGDAALLKAEQQSAEKARVSAALADQERQILADGGGATLDELAVEVSALDADQLPGSIAELRQRIDQQLQPRSQALAEVAGGQQKELDQMDGSADAAELAEQAQALLAAIRADAERYVRVKLAARILRDQIERYRQQNQGPLVKRASEHFTALTLGSFERLTIDFNDKDQAVLAGVRPDDSRIHVDGMSAGTRDQLYLALRLASLEKYIHSAEPMPFIVDDVLVDFDDQRSAAALQTLAELAEQTQVILFTHHARLVEQAGDLSASVTVHNLV